MPPGQTTVDEFEAAILGRLALKAPNLLPVLGRLHVLSREFTGVGSFTSFQAGAEIEALANGPISLDALISVPGVPTGLGALLFVKEGFPNLLEIHTFGNELWDGTSVGFNIPEGL